MDNPPTPDQGDEEQQHVNTEEGNEQPDTKAEATDLGDEQQNVNIEEENQQPETKVEATDQGDEEQQNVNIEKGNQQSETIVEATDQGDEQQNINIEEGNEQSETKAETTDEGDQNVNEEETEPPKTDSEVREDTLAKESTEPPVSVSPTKIQADKSKKKSKKQQVKEPVQKEPKKEPKEKKAKKKGKTKVTGEVEEITTAIETTEISEVDGDVVTETQIPSEIGGEDEIEGNVTEEIEDESKITGDELKDVADESALDGENVEIHDEGLTEHEEQPKSMEMEGELDEQQAISASIGQVPSPEEGEGGTPEKIEEDTERGGRKTKKPKKGKGKGGTPKRKKKPELLIEQHVEPTESKPVSIAPTAEGAETSDETGVTVSVPSSERVPTGRRKSEAGEGKRRKRGRREKIAEDVEKLEIEERRPSIEGIIPLIISEETQKLLGCVIGEQVTTERPWIPIKKETFNYLIETEEDISELSSVINDIKELNLEDIWVGYDSSNETPDSFFICVTEAANAHVTRVLEFTEAERQRRVQESVTRSCGEWTTLGSEKDIEDWAIIDSRPLYQVEAETTVQKVIVETNFTDFNVEDTFSGYRHILPVPGKFPEQILKNRKEAAVQACPETMDTPSQTYPPLPENNWTQYEQVVFVTEVTDELIIKQMKEFMIEQFPFMDRIVEYNSSFDLYKDDYPDLVLKEVDKQAPQKKEFKEYISFADVLRCKDKLISAIAWHPMWTGIVACAYVDHARCVNIRLDEGDENEVLRAVHGNNPVLIWSFVDSLAPKLILECSREVNALGFCPFNENILIGGCNNGQVVVWDLTDKLRKVEEVIHLTREQQMYRETLFSLMTWMKNTRRLDYITPAAMSSLQYSPARCITAIQWLSPQYEITRTGKYGELRNNETLSLQFFTSSEDGDVCIWDLQAPISKAAGLIKSRKKKKPRPAALVADVSCFRYLHMVFTPIFRINIVNPDSDKGISVSTLSSHIVQVDYEPQNPKENTLNRTLSERLLYNPVLESSGSHNEQEFYAGTIEGQLILGVWEGYDTNTGEVVNSEISKFKSWGEIHEAPVSNISRSPFFDNLILTSSSKVFAIWRVDVTNVPLLWRRSRVRVTSCSWSETYPNVFSVLHADGSIEVWNLLARSDKPVMLQSISGRILTSYNFSKIGPVQNVVGIADHRGALRVFKVPAPDDQTDVSEEIKATKKILTREKQKRDLFIIWQKEWLERNKEALQAEQDAIEEELQRQEEELKKQEKLDEERREREETLLKRILKRQALNVDIMKQAKEHWEGEQERRYIKIILEQKKLDKNDLLAKIEPLEKIREQEKKKKNKEAERIQQKDKIFEDTKNLLFPELLMIVKTRLFDASLLKSEIDEMEPELMGRYEETEVESLEQVQNKPYKYDFGWRDVYFEGKDSKKIVDTRLKIRSARDGRYIQSKNERVLAMKKETEAEAVAEAKEQEAPAVVEKSNLDVFGLSLTSTVQFKDSESGVKLSKSALQPGESLSRIRSLTGQDIKSRSIIKSSASHQGELGSRSQIQSSATNQDGGKLKFS